MNTCKDCKWWSDAAWLYALGYISLEECSEMLDESVQDS